MKKLVIAAIAATALNTTANAENCASNFSGFYAGVQAGMNAANSTYKFENSSNPEKASYGAQSFLGGLFAGYGMGIGNCAYVGGEAYVNFHDTNIKYEFHDRTKHTAKNNINFGAKVRLGYTVSPQAMIFLGLGVESAYWQLKHEVTPRVGTPRINSNTKCTLAFAPSVGTDLFMTKNIFVRAEYTYVAPVSLDLEIKPESVDHKINLHRFTLGLGYKF
jgi:outer membrane autotransporter protein